MSEMSFSRRQVLGTLAMAGAAHLVDPGPVLARLAADTPCAQPAGTLLGTLPLFRERSQVQPFGVKFATGLDARRITDLSLLERDKLITANGLGYIRTEMPPLAMGHRARGGWTIDVKGLVEKESTLTLTDITDRAKPQGPHLFECSGNANPSNFGLMSVAEFDGTSFAELVDRLKPAKGATAVLVSGWDHEVSISGRSVPGASWVFPLDWVKTMNAFLATRMNGEPLPDDHGAAVRLVNPGWYGCSWIKWVNEIRFVGSDEPATSQMIEFANRTHQKEAYKLARDYTPADIQTAATPVRVEKRKSESGLEYRIVGIVWGGQKPVDRLSVRFSQDEAWRPVAVCPAPKTHKMWALWEYRWKPAAPGVYSIALKADPSIPQRRLDSGYYVRQVSVTET
jgi:DMSO/TMAO reductase YedYZ molybdopterin-dependent catalytic subunit